MDRALRLVGLIGLCTSLAWTCVDDARGEESHPGLAAEAMYAEALLAYNQKRYGEAAKILDEAMRTDPKNIPVLEMRALTLKIEGNDPKSVEVYRKLIELKPKEQRAPYHFELGTIYQKHKKYDAARAHFSQALAAKYNVVPTHFYLGSMDFTDGNLDPAEKHFRYVLRRGPPELKVASMYFLGLVNFRAGYGASGTAHILAAKSMADRLPDDPGARTIGQATTKILEPFSQPQWFVNATFTGQYDSNVGQIPLGITDPAQLSGKETSKVLVSAGAGRMTAPLSTLQLVGSYRASYNKNLNSQTKAFEYFTHTGSLYFNLTPLAELSGGLKTEGSFLFQNQAGATADTYTFGKSSLTFTVGPFMKWQVLRSLAIQLETTYRTQTSYVSPTASGQAISARLEARSSGKTRLFNPGGNVNFEKSNTEGLDTRYTAFGGGVSNAFSLNERDTITLSVDLLSTTYPEAAVERSDLNFPIRANWAHVMNSHWSLLLDASYTNNSSNIPTSYSYNRLLAGLGVAWNM
jgi:tetratricopeptide (TPR) repeat protein